MTTTLDPTGHAAARGPTPPAALKVEDLEVAYIVRGIPRPVLRGVSFEIAPGEAYGLVGESGCGKSTTAYAAVRYLPRNGRITGGRILVAGDDITAMSDDEVRQFRMRPRLDGLPGPGRRPQSVDLRRAAGRSRRSRSWATTRRPPATRPWPPSAVSRSPTRSGS